MRKIFLLMLLAGFVATLQAGQKYNAMENRWETVPDNWENKYNAFDNSWSYQPRDAQVEYNPFENTWDWNSGHN